MDISALKSERTRLFQSLFESKVPQRVPVDLSLGVECTAEFGGTNLAEAQWNTLAIQESADKICQILYSDTCPFRRTLRYPSYYEILRSQSFVMGSSGFIQHPEVMGMQAEDYDYLIEKPYDCLLERVIPRQYKAFNPNEPVSMALNLTKSYMAYSNDFAEGGRIISGLVEKYGYYPGSRVGFTAAPFDFIADQLRGFKEISMDIRRMPDKLAEACEAVYPIVFKKALPAKITPHSTIFIPLHMPTFMREKDFARLWWPTFKRMVDEYASLGLHCQLFCEDDWTRYLDYLADLPVNTVLLFEYGDPKLIKEKLGKKHILSGLYPLTMLQSESKQNCLDKAKELIDIMAPGGKFYFSPDKVPLMSSDFNLDNLCALGEFVRDYGVYSNPGEQAGMIFNQEDYRVDPSASRKLESKYFTTWEQFKAQNPEISDHGRDKLQQMEEQMFQYMIYLLL